MSDEVCLESVTIPFPDDKGERVFPFRTSAGKDAIFTLVYGVNGSGKSTFARSVRVGENVEYRAVGERRIVLEHDLFPRVYDQEFIRENFLASSVQEEGILKPVILLGEASQHIKRIDEISAEISDLENEAANKIAEKKGYEEEARTCVEEIKKHANASISELGKTWRQLNSVYSSTARNIRKETIGDLRQRWMRLKGVGQLSSLIETCRTLTSRYEDLGGGEKIIWSTPDLLPYEEGLSRITKELGREHVLSSPRLSQIEANREIGVKLRKRGSDFLREVRDDVLLKADTCPTCFQHIDDKHREWVTVIINEIISERESDDLVVIFKDLHLPPLEEVVFTHQMASSELVREGVREAEEECGKAIKAVNDYLDRAIDSPEVLVNSIEEQRRVFSSLAEELKRHLDELRDCYIAYQAVVTEYNQDLARKEQVKRDGYAANDDLLAFLSADLLEKLASCDGHVVKLEEELSDLQGKVKALKGEVDVLESQMKGTEAAAEEINRLIRIAQGENGMQIRASARGYHVVNRNKDLLPGALSTGECNLLSLCYFFLKASEGEKISERFRNRLLILDDPLSSFDKLNKYGVLDLIRYFSVEIGKSENARLVILTHDFEFASFVAKMFNVLDGSRTAIFQISFYDGLLSLSAKQLGAVNYYKEHLRRMFKFATEEPSLTENDLDARDVIEPNHVRLVWEGFSTFLLDGQISEGALHRKIPLYEGVDEKLRTLLEYSCISHFINRDSHSEEHFKLFNFALQSSLSVGETRKMVKEILSVMHLLAPQHIPCLLESRREERSAKREELDRLANEVLSAYDSSFTTGEK